MIIRNIKIKNFQSYYGEQTIEFGEGLNLVIGNGGKGKSKLFNAFYWVLFGKIYITGEGWCSTDNLPQSAHGTLHKHEFVNKKALHDCLIDGQVECSVILELVDDKHKLFYIERSVRVTRNATAAEQWDEPKSWNTPNNSLKVTRDIPTGTKTDVGIIAEGIIADLFPEGIRGYIWFQGESLDNLIDFRKKQNLKDAVKHISYYPYYEKLSEIISLAKKRIEVTENKKLREANKHNDEVRSLLSRINALNKRILEEEENKKKYENNISQIEIALAEDETKVQGLAGYSNLVNDYNAQEKEIIKINDRLTALDDEQRRLLPSLWILRGTDNLITRCKEIIQSHVEEECTVPEKKYLDNPSKTKLEEILYKDHRCFVCGSLVDDEHPDTKNYILKRIRMQEEYLLAMEDYRNNMEFSKQFNMFIGRIQDYPDSLLLSLKSIDKQYNDIEEEIEKLMMKRRKHHDKKSSLDKDIEELKHKHGIDPIKEAGTVGVLSSNIRASRSSLEEQKRKLRSCESALANYKSDLKVAEKELENRGIAGETITSVAETEWKNISVFLEDVCKKVREDARKKLLRDIEKRSNEFYQRFTEHDNGYKGQVEISEDYSIKFDAGLNTSHEDRKKMSIINALLALNQKALDTYYPFISDAPTSSFDPSTTYKYLVGIKDIFEQTIIMTKDVEVDSDKYNALFNESKVSHIYQLGSKIYRDDSNEPEIYEVSTEIKTLKA